MATGDANIELDGDLHLQSETGATHGRLSPPLEWERTNHDRTGWLAPIEIQPCGDSLDLDSQGRRPSRKGFLPIFLLKYLEVVEWAGRQVRTDKRGSVPESLAPIFERLGFDSTGFLESMLQFAEQEKYFAATERRGQPERSVDRDREKVGV